jgi:hypothetical protein
MQTENEFKRVYGVKKFKWETRRQRMEEDKETSVEMIKENLGKKIKEYIRYKMQDDNGNKRINSSRIKKTGTQRMQKENEIKRNASKDGGTV